MRHIDLFSGIGGFALAAHWAGYQTEVFCERDSFCQSILKHHWPTVPIVSDIRDFDGSAYRGADLLTGGFPCQPFSVAGKRRGDTDDRYLWPEMLRVISEARPHWIVAENVPGIINMALDTVLFDLEAEGYETGTLIIPACAVNAPHRRDRVWIVAYSKSNRVERPARKIRKSKIGGFTQGRMDAIGEGETMAHAAQFMLDRSGDTGAKRRDESTNCRPFTTNPNRQPPGRTAIARRQCGIGQSQPHLGQRYDGLPARLAGYWDGDWERGIPRVASGIPQRASRLKALGNAIVPQVAYEILRLIQNPMVET